MKKHTLFALLAVLSFSLLIRIHPLSGYAVWGSDTGEYYYLTDGLAQGGRIVYDYNGWGSGYPYFPPMFIIAAALNLVSGADVLSALLLVGPLVSSLCALPLFFISKKLLRDERIGLIAAGVAAVALPIVFTGSHSMPGAVGDFLALMCIWLLLEAYDNPRFLLPLFPLTLVLVATHHLSTYFLFISVVVIALSREILGRTTDEKKLRIDALYVPFLFASMMTYWLAFAPPFRDRVMKDAFGVSPAFVVAALCASLALIPLIIKLYRKLNWHYRPPWPGWRYTWALLALTFVCVIGLMFATVQISIPGTSLDVDPRAPWLLLPLAVLIAFVTTGTGFTKFYRGGAALYAWMGAITVSFLIMSAIGSKVILPYRHFEYLMEPAAILIGLGVVKIYDYCSFKPAEWKRYAAIGAVVFLILTSTASAYPPQDIMSGFEEGTNQKEMEALPWVGAAMGTITVSGHGTALGGASQNTTAGTGSGNISAAAAPAPRSSSALATDHRMSSMAFGFAKINASWEDANLVLHGADFNASKAQLEACAIPSGVKSLDYVLITLSIERGVALKQWENAVPMSKEAKEKFEGPQFVKVFDNGDARVYHV